MPARLCRGALVATILAAGSIAVGRSPRYQIEILPVSPGCQAYSLWHGLSEQGPALGVQTCDDWATQRAVAWTREGLVELGSFGGPNSYPYGLNARGEIVGTAETPQIYQDGYHVTQAFQWGGGELRELRTLGGPIGAATAINATGTIVGACQAVADPGLGREPIRACVWDQGEVRDLGDLGGPEAWAYDVNGRGWVVGGSDTSEPLPSGLGFAHHAFLHDGRAVRDLGTLGGLASISWALNELGEVVGSSQTGRVSPDGYALWHAFLWRDGELRDLGTLGGPWSDALDINDRGQIVGWSLWRAANGAYARRAVLWDGSVPVDLNALVDGAEGWILESATAIDERGRILANGYRDGKWRVLLLTPASRP